MKLQTLVLIVVASLTVIFGVSYMKEYFVKTEGFNQAIPTCTYTAIAIPNAYIPNCSGTQSSVACIGYKTLSEAQTACNSVLGCKGITYRLDTATGNHYTLRNGFVANPTAPVVSTVSSWNNESSYVITNLAVCKPNWQSAPPAGSAAGAVGAAGAGAGAGAAGTAANMLGVTVPGGTMVLTAATNTMWANSMASQPAPLQGGASVTVAGAGGV